MTDAERADKAIKIGLELVAIYEETAELFEQAVVEAARFAGRVGVDTTGMDTTEGEVQRKANAHLARAALLALEEG